MRLQGALASTRVHLRNTLVRPMFQVTILAQPVAMVLLTRYVYDPGDPASRFFVMLGSGLSGVWVATAFSSAGDLNRERWYGTVQAVMLATTPLWLVSAGRALGALLLSLVPVVVSLTLTLTVMGLGFPQGASAWGVVLGVLAFGLACHAFGLLLSHIFLLSRRTTILQNFLEWPLLITFGILFPIDALPGPVQAAARALPMRWAGEVVGDAFVGRGVAWAALGLALGLSAVCIVAAVVLSGTVERRVRVTASLEIA